jgi:transcriptional regulator with GAF, ATPase, and Fis domain
MLQQQLPVLIGDSVPMVAVRQEIEYAARSDAKVLILGETGVGKDVVARLIHAASSRRGRAFLAINCSGVPETLLESELFGHVRGSFTGAYRDKIGLARQADKGTLFLDELGEMSLRMQAVILRFAETGEIQPIGSEGSSGRLDVRLIAATNRDLRAQIATRAFREDLYYRLNVLQVVVPPLRERCEDIPQLLRHYLAAASTAHGLPNPEITDAAERVLVAYAWPGNVRELRNVAERLVLADLGRPMAPNDLPSEIRAIADSSSPMPATRLDHVHHQRTGIRSTVVHRLWDRMAAGEDFWTVVYRSFKAREVTKADLLALVDLGLQESRGSYRTLLSIFNLPTTDYKRFHAFLHQQQCNLPVAPYRQGDKRRRA